jgi:hypothetical protein
LVAVEPVAVRQVAHLVTGFGEQVKVFATAFDGAWLRAVWAEWNLIFGKHA